MKQEQFRKIADWMYRHARPLDLARWRLYFEDGKVEDVWRALAAYQNEDGGFGNALEADSWNPYSSPLTTSEAVRLIGECGGNPPREIADGILRYLESGDAFSDGLWAYTVPTNNDYPHAPWWTHTPESSCGRYPSTILAGFALLAADRDSALWRRALKITSDAVEDACSRTQWTEQHEAGSFFGLWQMAAEAGLAEELRLDRLKDAMGMAASQLIERDPEKWGGYVCRPSWFVESPSCIYYPEYRELMEKELDFIEDGIGPDGVWNINWDWGGKYGREFAVSEMWWRGDIAVKNTALLRRFGRL